MNTWIKVSRELLSWEWYNDDACKALLLHIMLKANWRENYFIGKIMVKPGELITSQLHLAEELGKSRQQIRDSLEKLQATKTITVSTTSKYTRIKLNKYLVLLDEKSAELINEEPSENQVRTNKEPSKNQVRTTTKEEYNINNINNTNVTNTLDNTNKNIFFDCGYTPIPNKEASYYVTGAEELIESLRHNDCQY